MIEFKQSFTDMEVLDSLLVIRLQIGYHIYSDLESLDSSLVIMFMNQILRLFIDVDARIIYWLCLFTSLKLKILAQNPTTSITRKL